MSFHLPVSSFSSTPGLGRYFLPDHARLESRGCFRPRWLVTSVPRPLVASTLIRMALFADTPLRLAALFASAMLVHRYWSWCCFCVGCLVEIVPTLKNPGIRCSMEYRVVLEKLWVVRQMCTLAPGRGESMLLANRFGVCPLLGTREIIFLWPVL